MADLNEIESSQSVKIVGSSSSGLELTPVKSSTAGELHVNDGLRSGGVYGTITVTATASELKVGASRLVARKFLSAQPNGTIYWGFDSSVTSVNGTKLAKGQNAFWQIIDDSFQIWVITTGGNVDVRVVESP